MADKVHITKRGIQALKWDSDARQYVEQKIPTALHVLRCACHLDADVTLGDLFRAGEQDPELVRFLEEHRSKHVPPSPPFYEAAIGNSEYRDSRHMNSFPFGYVVELLKRRTSKGPLLIIGRHRRQLAAHRLQIREILGRRGVMFSCGRALAAFAVIGLSLSGAAWPQNTRPPEEILRHALQLHQSGDIAAAIAEYRDYLSQVPGNAMARSNLGAALSRTGRYQEAIVEYKQALALQPDNPAVRVNLALAYYKATEISQAAAELEKVVAGHPDDRQTVLLLSDCYLRLGENKKAAAVLSPLQRETPDDKALDYMLGTALIRDGQTERGQSLIDRILRDGDSAEAHLLIGESKLQANDFVGALEEFKKALEINPQLLSLNSYYGTALANTGDIPGAEAAFRKELALDANDYVANFQLGKLLQQDGNNGGSRRSFERALRQRPNAAATRYQLALLDLEEGQAERARATLEILISENPRDVSLHISLATAYYRLKRKEDGNKQRAIVLKLNAEKQQALSGGMAK